jgi:hypothetical protein
MGALRPVNDRNYNVCGRLRQRKRPYTFVYDRCKHRPGGAQTEGQFVLSLKLSPSHDILNWVSNYIIVVKNNKEI